MLANRVAGDLEGARRRRGQRRRTLQWDEGFCVWGVQFSGYIQGRKLSIGKRVSASYVGRGAKELEFRYGISFISVEQAKKNLQREIPAWGFDRVRDAAKARWNEALGQIDVEGGTETQRRVFYTALYRCFRTHDQHHGRWAILQRL